MPEAVLAFIRLFLYLQPIICSFHQDSKGSVSMMLHLLNSFILHMPLNQRQCLTTRAVAAWFNHFSQGFFFFPFSFGWCCLSSITIFRSSLVSVVHD